MRIQPPTGAKEKRLAALLEEQGRSPSDPALAAVVEDALLLGSLELAGVAATWAEVRAARGSGEGPAEVLALRQARAAVRPDAPLTVDALQAWHAALFGAVGFRRGARSRDGAATAPPELIEARLATLEEWLDAPGARSLKPEQAGALAYARVIEVAPFDDGNGRVARLATSHLLVRGGLRPPVLVGADGPYLVACLRAAFRLETEPLVSLLTDASGRALDVMVQALERGEA